MFGLQNPPSVPSIVITVSADNGYNATTRIKCSVQFKGIKPENRMINITHSLPSNEGKY